MTSGDTSYLQNFVKEQVQNTKDKASSGGLEQYFKVAPGGEEILQKLSKLSKLQEIAQKHGDEAEKDG